MPTLTPVDYDPFGSDKPSRSASGPRLTPVSGDPFKLSRPTPTTTPTEPTTTQRPQPSSGLLRRTVGDTAVDFGRGIIGVGEAAVGLANIPTFGYAGKGLEAVGYDPKTTKEMIGELHSPERKAALAEVDQAEGFTGTAKAMLRNPSTIAGAVAESAPSILGGGAIARGLGAVSKLSRPVRAAIGEGAVGAGGAAEGIRQETEDGTLSGKQVAAALGTGATTALLGYGGGRLAQRLGIGDVDTVLAGAGRNAIRGPTQTPGLARRTLQGAATEGVLEEMPQSATEQMWQNLALDRPLTEGVPESAAAGMLTGTAIGGPFAALSRPRPTVEPAPDIPDDITGARARALERMTPQQREEMVASDAASAARPEGNLTDTLRQQQEGQLLADIEAAETPEDRAAAEARLAEFQAQVAAWEALNGNVVDGGAAPVAPAGPGIKAAGEAVPGGDPQRNRGDDAGAQGFVAGVQTDLAGAGSAADTQPALSPGQLFPRAAPRLPDGSPVPDPSAGPLSRAVNEGVASGAVATQSVPAAPVRPAPGSVVPPVAQPWVDESTGEIGQPAPDLVREAVQRQTEASTESATEGNPVMEIPVAGLVLSEDVPQFKSGASDETGVVEPLGGSFDRRGVGPIQVWRRNDGRMEVISGRHRLDLARRSGESTIPAQVYDEASGFTAGMAASLDAELNIRDGQGKVKDYVQFFQQPAFDGEEGRQAADARGLLARATGRRAYTIASQGSPELIAAHSGDQVTDEAAVQVAQAAPNNEALQNLGLKLLADGRPINVAVNTMHAAKVMQGPAVENGDLFGFDDSAIQDAVKMAGVAVREQRTLAERIAAIRGASKRPDLARKEGVDVRNPKALESRLRDLTAEKARWENWSSHPDLAGMVRQELGIAEPTQADQAQADPEPESIEIDPSQQGFELGSLAEPTNDAPPQSPQDGLFAPPTRREELDAEIARRDAARNGQTATGRTDMMAGDGELFAGPRPEQADIEQQANAYGATPLETLRAMGRVRGIKNAGRMQRDRLSSELSALDRADEISRTNQEGAVAQWRESVADLKGKQPWEMTRDEWARARSIVEQAVAAEEVANVAGVRSAQAAFRDFFGYSDSPNGNARHDLAVFDALEAGHPVPESVRAEYRGDNSYMRSDRERFQELLGPAPSAQGRESASAENARERITPDTAAEMRSGDIVVDDQGNEYRAHTARHDWLEAHPIINGRADVSADSRVVFLLTPSKADVYPERRNVPIYATGRNIDDQADAPNKGKPSATGAAAGTIEGQDALFDRLRDGAATLADYKAGWAALQENREAIQAQLGKLTKAQLLEIIGPRYRNDPKDRLVRSALLDMETRYAVGRSISYTMGSGSAELSIARLVESATQETLDAYAKDVADARAARTARIDGAKDPQTLAEFEDAVRLLGGESKLAPEQRARFDALRTDARREQREAEAKRNATVQQVSTGDTGMTLVETKHTQKGHDLFVVRLDAKVERDVYDRLNTAAKRLGGYYSSFRGNGAVPGFQFTTRDAAQQFMAVRDGSVDASAQQQAKADAKTEARAESLAEKAAALRERAEESLNRDRKANTARRAAQAASAKADARALLAVANTMDRISQAIESGKARMLSFIRHRSQVETLDQMLKALHWNHLRDKGVDWEKAKDAPISEESITAATLPPFHVARDEAAKLAAVLRGKRGGKQLGDAIAEKIDYADEYAEAVRKEPGKFILHLSGGELALFKTKREADAAVKNAKSVPAAVVKLESPIDGSQWAAAMTPEAAIERKRWLPNYDKKIVLSANAAQKIVDLAGTGYGSGVPYWWETALDQRAMLAKLGIETNYEFREALREYLALREAPKAEDRLSKLERDLVGRKDVGVDFFPTPPAVVQRLIEQTDIGPGMRVLEPSAGKGDIAEAMRAAAENLTVDTVEMSSTLRDILEAKGFDTIAHDFLDMPAEPVYDRIVMNPPFGNDNGAAHVRHAYDMLKPGGRLVAVMGAGTRGKAEFDAWLETVGGLAEPLPEGSFKSSFRPTGVATQVVVIDKDGDAIPQPTQHNRAAEEIRNPLSVQEVENAIAGIRLSSRAGLARNGVEVVVVPDYSRFPPNADGEPHSFTAGYDPGNNRIVIVAMRVGSPESARKALLHEMVGHFGLNLFPPQVKQRILEAINRTRDGKALAGVWNEVKQLYADKGQIEQAEEVFARIAEDTPSGMRLWWDRFLSKWVLPALRALGLTGDTITRTDLRVLAADIAQGIREGAAQRTNADGSMREQRVFHGTPHRGIEQTGFQLNKIGTGEGAQAYGYGMYFASQRGVAEGYRKNLTRGPERYFYDGELAFERDASGAMFDLTDPRTAAIFYVANDGLAGAKKYLAGQGEWGKSAIDALKSLDPKKIRVERNEGQLYHAEIPDDHDLLDWDKPLSEQPEKVKAALAASDHSLVSDAMKMANGRDVAGRALYDMLTIAAGKQMADTQGNVEAAKGKAASEALQSIGIPGLRYLDGQSRRRPLKDIKREFLAELPQDADFADVVELLGTGTFSPKNEALLQALAADGWLGFDYPSQALSAVLGGQLGNYDPSPALVQAVSAAQDGGTHNYVIWDESLLTPEAAEITPYYSRPENNKSSFLTSAVDVRSAVRQVLDTWKGDKPVVRVVQTVAEARARGAKLPADAPTDFEGWWDGNATVWIVAGNNRDVSRALEVLSHEAIGHYGIERIMEDKDWARLVADVKRLRGLKQSDVSPKIWQVLQSAKRRYGQENDTVFAKEFLAIMSEQGVRSGLTSRVAAAIRQFLAKIGIPVNIGKTFREAELLAALHAGRQRVTQGERSARQPSGRQPAQAMAFSQSTPTFYSAMLESVADAKGLPKAGGTAQQWKGWMDGAIRRGEFKQSERDWLGVDAWLDAQDKAITREQLADFIRANEVQVEDVVLGDAGDRRVTEADYDAAADAVNAAIRNRLPWEEQDRLRAIRDDLRDQLDEGRAAPQATKFATYQLPGGENYRELLLTLSRTAAEASSRGWQDYRDDLHARGMVYEADEVRRWGAGAPADSVDQNAVARARSIMGDAWMQAYLDVLQNKERRPVKDVERVYRSSHFDQPNILAHVRYNERTDADGKRVLFIEEIQSDWHQAGRKKGYGPKLIDGKDHAYWRQRALDLRGGDPEAYQEAAANRDALQGRNAGVPDAPFKGTDEWAMLAFKRMVRHAAEQGFDRIAWATGTQQAERYDLSKQVEGVDWDKATNRLFVREKGAGDFVWKKVADDATESKLSDYIGKDVAEKLAASQPDKDGHRSLTGQDLKIGGEGMRGFYDAILPKAVNKWAKPFGAKTGRADFGGDVGTTHAIDLTPKMRDAALSGLPMFSRQAANFDQPNQYDFNESDYRPSVVAWAKGRFGDQVAANGKPAWQNFVRYFGDSKVVDDEGKPLVVYHGTRSDFTAFDAGTVKGRFPNSEGFYFTSRPSHASAYADSIDNAAEGFNPESPFAKPVAEGGNVVPAYVSLQNPKVITVSEWGTLESAVDGDGGARVRAAREAGHDGVIVKRKAGDEWDGTMVIAFHPEQIKSATGNAGTFDPTNPDIRFSRPDSAALNGVEYANGQEALTSWLASWSSALRLGGSRPRPVESRPEAVGQVARNESGAAEQGDASREEIREQSQRLIERAKAEGFFWGDDSPILAELDNAPAYGGAEHRVYIIGEGDSRFVIRATDNGFFGPRSDISPAQYLARLDDYSSTFPNLQTRLIGVSESAEVEGNAVIWTAQPYVRGTTFRNQPALAAAMRAHGWEQVGDDQSFQFRHTQTGAVIEDAHTDNVLQDDNGDLYPFDVVMEALPNSGRFSRPDPNPETTASAGASVSERLTGAVRNTLDAVAKKAGRGQAKRPDWVSDSVAGKFDTFSGKKPTKQWFDELKENAGLKLTQRIFDQYRSMRNYSEEGFMQAHLSRATDGTLETVFNNGIPILKDGAYYVDEKNGGLKGLLSRLGGVEEAQRFFMWIAGNRSEKLAGEGRENLFTSEDIKEMKAYNAGKLADGRNRKQAYDQALREFNRFQRAILDIAERAGEISPESRALWQSEFYIPFYRVAEETGQPFSPGNAGLVRQSVVKKLKGGTEKLGDPLENVLSNWSAMLSASMRNMSANKTLNEAVRLGAAERVPAGTKGATWTMVDGKQQHWMVHDKLLAESLEAMNFTGYNNPVMKLAGKFKRMLSVGVTVNPSYRIRNLTRDLVSALATADTGDVSAANPLTSLAALGKNFWKGRELTTRDSDTNIQLTAGGGAVRFGLMNDGDQAANAKKLIAMGVNENQILDTPGKVKNALRRAWDKYQDLGDRAETINRAVIYDRAIKAGKSHLQASFEARDLMNFTSMGSSAAVRALAQVLPFFNARLQGLDKLGRAAKSDPRRFWAVAGHVAMASALLYMIQGDDEDYQALPDYVRDTYWPVKLGGTWVYIPKPFELGSLGTVVERGAELMMAGDDYQAKDFRDSMVSILTNTLAMNPVPQIIKPVGEAWFNYDMFRNAPIDSMAQQRLLPQDRFTARTSGAAVLAGQAVGVSPQKIEHMVKGYFGWLGIQALNVGDLLARDAAGLPSNPNRDMTSVNNWFVVGDFVKEYGSTPSKYMERFYESQKELDQIYATATQARKAGDTERALELLNNPILRTRPAFQAADRRITRINQSIRTVTADRRLSATEKNRKLENLRKQREEVAKRVDRLARAAT